MSEDKYHFRIKKGDIEIEYSGTQKDTDTRYKEALEWVKSIKTATPLITPTPTPVKKVTPPTPTSKKPGPGRGGQRSPIISKSIDKLIEDGYFDTAKTESEIYAELDRRAVPGISEHNVKEALRRKARQGLLDRIKGAGKEYNYIKKAEKKT